MPRPKKDPAARRRHVVRFRLTGDELAAVRARAEAAQMSPSAYMREAVLKARVTVRPPAPVPYRLIAELGRIGVNLNQLVRLAQTTGQVPAGLERLCRTIEETVLRAVDREV